MYGVAFIYPPTCYNLLSQKARLLKTRLSQSGGKAEDTGTHLPTRNDSMRVGQVQVTMRVKIKVYLPDPAPWYRGLIPHPPLSQPAQFIRDQRGRSTRNQSKQSFTKASDALQAKDN